MTNEEIKQRIQYLVEHGGVWDDPIADLRRHLRIAMALAAIGIVGTWLMIATLH